MFSGEEEEEYITSMVNSGTDLMTGEQLVEIRTRYPWQVPRIREKFRWHGQADIPYDRAVRYYYGLETFIAVPRKYVGGGKPIDITKVKRIKTEEGPREGYMPITAYIDIETTGRSKIDVKRAPDEIVCLTVYVDGVYYHLYNYDLDEERLEEMWTRAYMKNVLGMELDRMGELSLIHCASEMEIISTLADVLDANDVSVVAGHNIKEFDWKYMKRRVEIREMRGSRVRHPSWKKYAILDTMLGYKKLRESSTSGSDSLSLDNASRDILGLHKIPKASVSELYENDHERLSLYNIMDTYLCYNLSSALAMEEFYNYFSMIMSVKMGDVEHGTKVLEGCLARAYGTEYIVATRTLRKNAPRSKVHGAIVMFNPEGVYRNVIEFDNKSEYPSVILTLRLDPLSLLKDYEDEEDWDIAAVAPSGRKYKDIKAPIPSLIEEQMKLRDHYRELRKKAKPGSKEWRKYKLLDKTAKEIMNSVYGALANKDSTYYMPQLANDITEVSRKHLLWNKRILEENPYTTSTGKTVKMKVIYGDTDSCKAVDENDNDLTYDELVEIGEHYTRLLNESFKDFTVKLLHSKYNYLRVKVDSFSRTYIQTGAKKRYAYLTFDDRVVWKGYEKVRGDSSGITKMIQEAVIEDFLRNLNKDRVIDIIYKIVTDIRSAKIEESLLGSRTSISSEGNYLYRHKEITKANVVPPEERDDYLPLGSSVSWYFVKGLDGIAVLPTDKVPSDYGLEIDREKVINMFVVKKMESICKVLGVDVKAVAGGYKIRPLF